MKKKIAILGSTGSIGKSTLEVISKDKENFDIFLLSANNNYKQLIKQAKQFNAKNVLIKNHKFYLKHPCQLQKMDHTFGQCIQIGTSCAKVLGPGQRRNPTLKLLWLAAFPLDSIALTKKFGISGRPHRYYVTSIFLFLILDWATSLAVQK